MIERTKLKHIQIFEHVHREICNYMKATGNKPSSVLIFIDYVYYKQALCEMSGDVGSYYEFHSNGTIFGHKPCLTVSRPNNYPLVEVVTK